MGAGPLPSPASLTSPCCSSRSVPGRGGCADRRHALVPAGCGGPAVISADGRRRSDGAAVPLSAVPYYAWANREEGAMRVRIPEG
ncbi:hypothetical protein ABZY09_29750 [Streptomyces sp. NPDC002928]|uniref:hypothetical protein n=1 Tax=Streptomyces sp. NPDC002928 TaxID=3154440 RepID=UPI0033BEA721